MSESPQQRKCDHEMTSSIIIITNTSNQYTNKLDYN